MQNILQLGNKSYIDVDLDENEFCDFFSMFSFENHDISIEYEFK